jgi:hypothetical protein
MPKVTTWRGVWPFYRQAGEQFNEVMAHTIESSVRQASQWFGPNLAAPRLARQFVLDTLAAWHVDVDVDLAALVTSELATNAVCHARTNFEVRVVQATPEIVRVEVSDTDGRLVNENVSRSLHDNSGRGLRVVDAVSRRWGVLAAENGKTVWCALDAHPKD